MGVSILEKMPGPDKKFAQKLSKVFKYEVSGYVPGYCVTNVLEPQ